MFRQIASLLCVVILTSVSLGQTPAVQKIESIKSNEDGWRWKIVFDEKIKAADTKAVMKFVKTTTTGTVFDGKESVEVDGKEAVITLGIKGYVRSSPRLKTLKFSKSVGRAVAEYGIEVDPWLGASTGRDFSNALALLDATQRGHKEGADDGITLTPSFKTKEKNGLTVTLTYSGGVYGK